MSEERVAPHAGAWIETNLRLYGCTATMSLPTRERGLKHLIWLELLQVA